MIEYTDDWLLGDRLKLMQNKKGHRAGTDALLLAYAALPFAKGAVADFGAGTGAAGLALALQAQQAVDLTLVEFDTELTALCTINLKGNQIASGRAVKCDITFPAVHREMLGLAREAFDLVIMNPPFRDSTRTRESPDKARALAHSMPDEAMADWIKSAAHHLKSNGVLAIIHRANAVGMLLEALGKGFGHVAIRFVHPAQDKPASRLLLTAQKGNRAPLQILPALILHEPDGAFTPEANTIHNGTAAQPD
jgi:tRNA1(Val) A37 N6-methylase TrmN6